ncbi:hypothetical protein LCGC14_1675150 [marine sediment metagenome]|uniref:Uncharacterized protein n=1 Tax=marine sediment metagenome TaxID=412755 RepID=A0A0F9ICM1_9ZZZZ
MKKEGSGIARSIWKLILGGAVTAAGWFLVAPELGEVTLTGAAVIGIALFVVGISTLSDVI